jgi:tetratricopeptide (TPR) repeat protein
MELSAFKADKPFMVDFIDSSLSRKSAFLTSLNISSENPMNPSEMDQTQITNFVDSLELLSSTYRNNCWYYFYKGLMLPEINRDQNFKLSLFNAQKSPGDLWLLYVACIENDIQEWDGKILNLLEKNMLLRGAEQSNIISRQMIDYAGMMIKKGEFDKANNLYIQAQRFGSDDLFYSYTKAWKISPSLLFHIPNLVQNSLHSVFISSVPHMATLHSVYWIIKLIFILMIITLSTIFLIKYLPYALHRFVDYFPSNIPYFLRLSFTCAIYTSFISFGVLPFIWISTILIFKHLSRHEKKLYSIVLILLCLAPLDVHIQSLFVRANNPQGPLGVFYRSVREGYTESVNQSTLTSLSKDPQNGLLQLAMINYSLKNGNLSTAAKYLETALSLSPGDPVVLTTAGNLAFFQNNFDVALKMYSKALEIAPTYSEALYNSGQCMLHKLQTVDAMTMIDKAVKYSPLRINNFMKANDRYFTDTVPVLRRIIFADYTPSLFWSHQAFRSVYNSSFASSYWGMSFLGIPSWVTLFISLAIVIYILINQMLSETKKPLRIFFECRYCGKLLCRACKNGSLCSSCADALKFINNEHVLEKLHAQITARSDFIRNTTHYSADIIFPGAGYILRGELFSIKTGFLILISSIIYVCYYLMLAKSAMFSHFHYLHLIIILPCLTYSLFFIVKYSRLISKEVSGYMRSLEV